MWDAKKRHKNFDFSFLLLEIDSRRLTCWIRHHLRWRLHSLNRSELAQRWRHNSNILQALTRDGPNQTLRELSYTRPWKGWAGCRHHHHHVIKYGMIRFSYNWDTIASNPLGKRDNCCFFLSESTQSVPQLLLNKAAASSPKAMMLLMIHASENSFRQHNPFFLVHSQYFRDVKYECHIKTHAHHPLLNNSSVDSQNYVWVILRDIVIKKSRNI